MRHVTFSYEYCSLIFEMTRGMTIAMPMKVSLVNSKIFLLELVLKSFHRSSKHNTEKFLNLRSEVTIYCVRLEAGL